MVVNSPSSMLMLGKRTAQAQVTCKRRYHTTHPPFPVPHCDQTPALCFPKEHRADLVNHSLSPEVDHMLWEIDSDHEH